MTIDPESAAIDATTVRAQLLAGRVPDDVMAAALGIGMRALYYWCEKGLPYIRICGRRYFDVAEAKTWMATRPDLRHTAAAAAPPPRPVGRPRRSVAAEK
jgi:hypothetical protein